MTENHDEVDNLFKQYLEDALLDPEVAKRKKKLLNRWQPVSWPSLTMAGVPVIALLSVFLVFQHLQLMPSRVKPPVVQSPVQIAPIPAEPIRKEPAKPALRSSTPVRVKKVASKVGSTMIYQNRDPNVPITVVWVFVR